MNTLNKHLADAKAQEAANSNAPNAPNAIDEKHPARPDAAGFAEGERPAVFTRLRKAVAVMQDGIDEQTVEIAKTRANMVELDVIMRRIEFNLHAFRRSIGNVRIKALKRKSMRLAGIAKRAEGYA